MTNLTPELVKDIRLTGSFGSGLYGFIILGDRVLFIANDGTNGYEPWVTDGTAAGTKPVADLSKGYRRKSMLRSQCL